MKSLLLAFALLLPIATTTATAAATDHPAASENATDRAFRTIYEAEWQWRIAQAPSWDEDSDNSGRAPSDHLSDVGPEAQARRLAYLDGVQEKLDCIDTAKLSVMIFSIIWGVLIFVRFLAFAGVSSSFASWITALGVSPYIVLFSVLAFSPQLGWFITICTAPFR